MYTLAGYYYHDLMIKLLIADDHKILLDGFQSLFKEVDDIDVMATASNGQEVLDLLNEYQVDIVLLDINMPILNGVETCKKISREFPGVKVIALSMYREASYVKRMKTFGAKGYVLKDDSAKEIVTAIRSVYKGKEYYSTQLKDLIFESLFSAVKSEVPAITRREKDVLTQIAEGHSNKIIADKLFISQHTVDSHRKNLLSKLDAKNTAELVKKAMERGLI
jgi:DNA-binding NarL/FixJ family response regulator